ncbi:MAG: acyl--CoA ligase [Bacteroidetes bacterium]|nr:acyl--CoA ligase [Bacteroidota bacterium]
MSDLEVRIMNGRSTAKVPASESMVRVTSIGAVLSEWAGKKGGEPFYTWYQREKAVQSWSWSGFDSHVNRLAGFLSAAGVKTGGRIATAGANHPAVILTYFAAWKLGACVIPLNMGEDNQRLKTILTQGDPGVIMVLDEEMDRVGPMAGGRKVVSSREVMSVSGPEWKADPAVSLLNHEALIVYTSGTTGAPKGVVLSQYQLLVDSFEIARWHRLSENDHLLCVLPVHHVNGTVVTHVTPLVAGARISMMQKFSPDGMVSVIRSAGITVTSVVPTLLQYLCEAAPPDSFAGTALRHVICGAGPLTVDLAMKTENRFGIPLIHGYGLSETTCYSCFIPIDTDRETRHHWLSAHGFPSIGVPLPCNDMDIQTDSGEPVADGIRGEIVIRGHNVMNGYDQNTEATDKAFTHGWFRSGDEGFRLTDGGGRTWFFITGRFKELIIRGGVNLSPLEIDEVINQCPGVKAGLAIGFDNDWYGEEVGAMVIRSAPDLTEEAVIAFCRAHLPASKCPKVVVFTDELPVTSTGKYQRGKVKDRFSAWKTTQFR